MSAMGISLSRKRPAFWAGIVMSLPLSVLMTFVVSGSIL